MGVHYDATRCKYVVRWQDGDQRRIRRFQTEGEAVAFAESVVVRERGRPPSTGVRPERAAVVNATARLKDERLQNRDGIYSYDTALGTRWRFAFRQSDGSLSTRRGFTSRTGAATARRRLVESIDRGEVKVARETFGTFWLRLLEERRPYLTKGSFVDFETHGRKRLVPEFGATPLARLDEDLVRGWLGSMVAKVEAGEVSAKTVNNARTCLSVALKEACRRGLIARNPCTAVPALPLDRQELDYLRLDEIETYLDACMAHYRPLASFLIGTGARISEAIAMQFRHVALDQGVVRTYKQLARDGKDSQPTKGKRFRSVQIGPGLVNAIGEAQNKQRADPDDWIFLCPTPLRGRYAGRTSQAPPSRKTAHDWHEAALVDAGLRDMPLHALRHTAAASWLATGHPLIFVQRQLGHRSITTTEEHYGHLELSFVRDAVARTEASITEAARRASQKAQLRSITTRRDQA